MINDLRMFGRASMTLVALKWVFEAKFDLSLPSMQNSHRALALGAWNRWWCGDTVPAFSSLTLYDDERANSAVLSRFF